MNIEEIVEIVFLCLDKNSLLESPRKGHGLTVLVSATTPVEIYYEDIHFEYLNFEALATYTDYPLNFFLDINRNYHLWSFQLVFEVNSKTNNINRAFIGYRNMPGIDFMKIKGLIDSKKFPEDLNKSFGLAFNEMIKKFTVQQY